VNLKVKCKTNSHKLTRLNTTTEDLQYQDRGPSGPRPRTFRTETEDLQYQDRGHSRPRPRWWRGLVVARWSRST